MAQSTAPSCTAETGTPASAVILGFCPDRRGINSALTRFISDHGGNILDYDQHVDGEQGVYFVRIEWELAGFNIPPQEMAAVFEPVAREYGLSWRLDFPGRRLKMAVFVSQQAHCLYDILARHQAGEWQVDIPLIISNHPDLESVARPFGVAFHCIPVRAETREASEQEQTRLLEAHQVDFVVLARYMQILSSRMVQRYPNRIINIHHSFLPAFIGAKPYHAAHARGVKIIGATSHYVTEELDHGPIIAQDVIRVSHKDSVEDLVRKGKDLEKAVLARAIWHHTNRQILVYNNKTVIFE